MSDRRMVPLRAIYQRVELRGRADLPLLSVYRDHGVVPRDERDDNNNRPSDDLSTYKHVRPGDLVVNKMKTWQGSLAVSRHEGIVSPAYFVARRVADVDDRFMHHLLRSTPLIAEYGARSKGIRPSQWDLPWDEFAAIKVSLPCVAEQRAIADYLDAETARIDALIAKKQRMMELLDERLSVGLDAVLGGIEDGVQLKYCAELLPGYAFSSEDFAADAAGPRLLRGINLNPGLVSWTDSVYLNATTSAPRRFELNVGDVVLGMDRPFVLGGTRVAIVDEDSAGSLLVQRVCRIRAAAPHAAILIAASLRSPRFRRYIEADLSGVSVPHLSDEQIGMFVMPDAVAAGDPAVAEVILAMVEKHRFFVSLVASQLDLLRERRQVLITAAVTGELEMPGVVA